MGSGRDEDANRREVVHVGVATEFVGAGATDDAGAPPGAGMADNSTDESSEWTRRRLLQASSAATATASFAGCSGGGGDEGPATSTPTPTLTEPKDYSEIDLVGPISDTRPRIIATQDDFERAARLIESDQYARSWYYWVQELGKEWAQSMNIGGQGLGAARRNTAHILVFAFMYRQTGIEAFADATWEYASAIASRDQWWSQVPSFDLNASETALGMAVAYDWLYDYWSASQRETVRDAIVETGLKNGVSTIESRAGWVTGIGNWTTVCNGGLVQGALAIADDAEGEQQQVVDDAIALSMRSINGEFADHGGPIGAIGERGAWHEGPTYWNYMSRYLSFYLISGKRFLDHGLADVLGEEAAAQLGRAPEVLDSEPMRALYEFLPGMTGYNGYLAYNETSNRSFANSPHLLFYAKEYDRPEWAGFQRWQVGMDQPITPKNRHPDDMADAKNTGNMGGFNSRGVTQILWYDPEHTADFDGLSKQYVDTEVVVGSMRDSWVMHDALWLSFVADRNDHGHGQVDVGHFSLDADGVRWAFDLGQYSRGAGLRSRGYDYSAQGHNTLVIEPDVTPFQHTFGGGSIEAHDHSEDAVYTIADLGDVYVSRAHGVDGVRRGYALPNGRSRALIQDEITGSGEKEVWWSMHTRADISTSGKTATLKQDGESLKARVHSPDGAEFEAMEAGPIREGFHGDMSAIPKDINKLAIKLEGATEPTITVELVPGSHTGGGFLGGLLGGGSDAPIVPLDDWSVDVLSGN